MTTDVAGYSRLDMPIGAVRGANRSLRALVRADDNYVVAFPRPNDADQALAKNVRKTFSLLMRRGGRWNAKEFAKLPLDAPERKFELLKALEAPVDSFGGEVFLTSCEMAFFVET